MEGIVYILLPQCVETEHDVFLSILRSVVSRTSVEKNPLNNALINGMKVDTFRVEEEDIGPWNQLNSEPQQIRQAMMLGYWAIEHVPSLGSRICGNTWKAPQRKFVQLAGRPPILPDEFDHFIFAKMKIRIIELHENNDKDMFQRLKTFVKAPVGIGKINRIQIFHRSKNMFSLDVDSAFDHQCWQALRSGVDKDKPSDSNVPQPIKVKMVSVPQIDQNTLGATISIRLPKRRRLGRFTVNDCSTVAVEQLTTESLRSVVTNKESGVNNFTNSVSLQCNEENTESQPGVMPLMQATADNLRCELNSKDELIKTLQRGLDATYKLYEKMETENTTLRSTVDKQREIISLKDKELEPVENQSQEPTDGWQGELEKLNETNTNLEKLLQQWKGDGVKKDEELERMNKEVNDLRKQLTVANTKCEDEKVALNKWKSYGMDKEKEIESAKEVIEQLKSRILKCDEELVNKWRQRNVELEDEKKNLIEAKVSMEILLQQWKDYADTKNNELERVNKEVNDLSRQLTQWKDYDDLSNTLTQWKDYGAAKDGEVEEMKKKNDQLQTELKLLGHEVNTIVPELNRKIEKLEGYLTESTDKCVKQETTLNYWKTIASTKEKEMEEAKLLIDTLRSQLNNFNCDPLETPVPVSTFEPQNICPAGVEPVDTGKEDQMTNGSASALPLGLNNVTTISVIPEDTETIDQSPQYQKQLEVFQTNDPIVIACRPILMAQTFGWIKFNKNSAAWPGFLFAPDDDGITRAQQIITSGYVADSKNIFITFNENIPETEKGKSQVKALQKFNKKFGLNFS